MICATGICSITDIKTINDILRRFNQKQEYLWNFCCSFNRLNDRSSSSNHSPCVMQLGKLIHYARGVLPLNHKIGIHHKPESANHFIREVDELLNIEQIYSCLDYIQLTGLWVNPKELLLLKEQFPQLNIMLQLPTYKMDLVDEKNVINRLMEYDGIITGITIDNSGGKGVTHNIELSSLIIQEAISNGLELNYTIAGGIEGANADSILKGVYDCTHIECSIDSQSKLHYGNVLLGSKLNDYIVGALKFYSEIKDETANG